MGGGQDNPAGLSSPPGGKINQPGYVAPPGVKITRVGGRISQDRLPPGGQPVHGWLAPPGGNLSREQDKLGHRHNKEFPRGTYQISSSHPRLSVLLTFMSD